MTDDIVTRLRNEADYWCFDTPVRIFLEAADEIERLRAERDKLSLDRVRWRKIAELAREAWNTDSWIVFNDEYLRMVHGD